MRLRSIFEEKKGILWLGNNGYGLFRYDGKILSNFNKEQQLGNADFNKNFERKAGTLARVWTITDDKKGNLRIGTIDNGVGMWNGKSLTNDTTKDGLGLKPSGQFIKIKRITFSLVQAGLAFTLLTKKNSINSEL